MLKSLRVFVISVALLAVALIGALVLGSAFAQPARAESASCALLVKQMGDIELDESGSGDYLRDRADASESAIDCKDSDLLFRFYHDELRRQISDIIDQIVYQHNPVVSKATLDGLAETLSLEARFAGNSGMHRIFFDKDQRQIGGLYICAKLPWSPLVKPITPIKSDCEIGGESVTFGP